STSTQTVSYSSLKEMKHFTRGQLARLQLGSAVIRLASLHAHEFTARVTQTNSPSLKAIRPPTSGPWFDVGAAERWRQELSPPTVPESPMLYLLDLHDVHPTVAVLDTYLRNLATEMK